MITADNFKKVLKALKFKSSEDKQFFEKKFPHFKGFLSVDFEHEKLIYPNEIKGRDRNTSFAAQENFVVFECVNRLLEKGYRPEHIELEKEWHLGHDARGGRADICVSDENGSMLFIIECKTWEREYRKALKDTLDDGAQLFSYWQQEQSTKWLVLYTSGFNEGKIEYKAPTINCTDDANIELLAERDDTIRLFKNAHTAPERYEVWKDTYQKRLYDDLIFSNDSVAYNIGTKPLLKKNLRDFSPDDKIVNQFEEILRHNNVSDKENAFNRLISLFICKLVDESTKDDNDEVEFQYKQGTDTYETLQDRLQRLHHDGMKEFMREEILYVPDDYPVWLFDHYTGKQRKEAIEDLRKTIRVLKFYSNNDFAFKDVHNEELFYQNGKILVEMVQLFEKYRIVYPSRHQFLGDLFEQLLNKGFKQNEGQFFTPMPITRFIWDSLPIKKIIHSGKGTIYPKVIDYACGAGHFLTEAVEAINYFAKPRDNDWVKDHIFGIEKDYRLARVAKISLFMNGAGDGNIIFGDGLDNAEDKQIKNGVFDILVANPPYSVKDFKQHLRLRYNKLELLDTISINSDDIEILFVERIAQLLKPKGIVAVILPISILDSAIYTRAREHLIKNFYIRAIVALGSKTFGATNQVTVIMFLEKFNEPPKLMKIAKDSIDAIFKAEELDGWDDNKIFEQYILQIGVEKDQYNKFLKKELSLEELKGIEHFQEYVIDFKEEPNEGYFERLYEYMNEQEREKLYYFSLIYEQKTVIIKSPTENKEQVEFLGYDWSNRKGYEGIQIMTSGGKMYDDKDREAEGTLAHAIRLAFDKKIPNFSEENSIYGCIRNTKDMFSFSRSNFDKKIELNIKKEYVSKYPLHKIDSLQLLLQRGKTPNYGKSAIQVIKSGQARGFYKFDFSDKYFLNSNIQLDDRKLQKGDILINSTGVGTAGRVTIFNLDGDYVVDSHITIFRPNEKIISEYALFFLAEGIGFKTLESMANGAGGQIELSIDTIQNIKIPIPPVEIQQEIVKECKGVIKKLEEASISIKENREQIDRLFNNISKSKRCQLSVIFDWGMDVISTEQVGQERYVTTDTMLQGCKGIKKYENALSKNTVRKFCTNDILLSNIRPYLQKLWLATFDGGCSNDVLVLKNKDVNKYNSIFFAYYLKRKEFFDYIMQNVSGAKMPRGKKDHIIKYEVKVPPIEKQNEIVEQIKKIEKEIVTKERILQSLQGKTDEILDKYLK